MKIQYACPRCGESLKLSSEHYDCKSCGYLGHHDAGIVDLIVDPDFYYGEIDRQKMQRLAQDSRSQGWRNGLLALLAHFSPSTAAYHRHHVITETRAGWKFLLNKPNNGGVVLDLGCGWGPTSVSLARVFGHVVALDATRERLDFLQQRCHEEGLTNLTYCRAGDGTHLPFAEHTFDTVILNGVLEWVPVGKKGNPKDCQISFLKEVRRILKPDGQLYLGIENRIGFKYFLGNPEDHTGVRFLSLVPRFLADIYSRVVHKKPFRTYTYTRTGLRKLLTLGGFKSSRFYIPSMDYREFSQVDSAEGPRPEPHVIVNSLKRKLWYWLRKSAVYPSLCLAHSVIASKEESKHSILDELVELAATKTGQDAASYHLSRCIVSSQNAVIAEFTSSNGNAIMLKIPSSSAAEVELQMNHDLLTSLRKTTSPSLLTKLPSSMEKLEVNGIAAFAETRFPGVSAQTLLTDTSAIETILAEGKKFLSELHKQSDLAKIINASFLSKFFKLHLTHLQSHYSEKKQDSEFQAITDYLTTRIGSLRLPTVPMHNDFWFGNLMVDKNHHLSGVIDWGSGILNGIPVIDLCQLIIEGKIYTYGTPVAKNFRDHLFAGDFSQFNFAMDYLDQIGVKIDDLDAFAILSWMLSSNRRLPRWKAEMAFDLITSEIDAVMSVIAEHVGIRRKNTGSSYQPAMDGEAVSIAI